MNNPSEMAFVDLHRYMELLEMEKEHIRLKDEYEHLITFLIGTDRTQGTNLLKDFCEWEKKRGEKISTMFDLGKLTLEDIVKGK